MGTLVFGMIGFGMSLGVIALWYGLSLMGAFGFSADAAHGLVWVLTAGGALTGAILGIFCH